MIINKALLLAGTVISGFFLIAQPALGEPSSDIRIAQAQPTDQQQQQQRDRRQGGQGQQQQRGQERQQERQQQRQERVQERQEQRQERQEQRQERVQERQQQRQERVQERQQQQQQRGSQPQTTQPSQPQTTQPGQSIQPGQQTQPGQVPGRGPGGQQRALDRQQTPGQTPGQQQTSPGQTLPGRQQTLPGRQPAQPGAAGLTAPSVGTPTSARRLDDFRGQRREVQQGGRTVIQEPGRTIIRDGGRLVIQHNETDRFRVNARNVQTERRGRDTATIVERPNGVRIITVTDENGRMLRRIRRNSYGREVILIDNTRRGTAIAVGAAVVGGIVVLNMAAPVVRIPRDRYIVEAEMADRALIYETLMAPPIETLERDYTLDEIRYNAALRDRMRRVDIDTVTFDTGSWEVTPDQVPRLQVIAEAILQAIQQNPDEVFLMEGHTDAVGDDVDNLSLSDRRAEAVAQVLTEQFNVPPENLTTQGYGEQQLKVPTDGPERRNRRVTCRRITPLLNGPVAQRR